MKIIKLKPNIRFEKATAKTGYTWGKKARDSNIVKILRSADLGSDIRKLGIKASDVVAERWLVSDDLELGSQLEEAGGQTLRQLFAKQGKELLGPRHFKEYGPHLGCIMKQLDTNKEPSKGSLSIQIHPRTEHPNRPAKPEMWQGQGQIYLGFKKDITQEEIRKTWQDGNLESLLNQISLSAGDLVLVKGGVIHALRYDSFIYEWSMAPGEDDIDKGNLKDATVSPYDRTDGKTQRPGKEDLEGSLQLLRESDGFRIAKKESLFVKPKTINDSGGGNIVRALFRTPEVFVNQLIVKTQQALSTQDRGFPIYVDWGCVEVVSDGKVIDLIKTGEERLVPHSLAEIKFINKDPQASKIYQWYAPFKGEK